MFIEAGRGSMKAWLSVLVLLAGLGLSPTAGADAACQGRFVNLITDICWRCLFPISIGSVQVGKGDVPDTGNPGSPIQFCPMPPLLFQRIGLAIGYWEPMAMTDVTRTPGCLELGDMDIAYLSELDPTWVDSSLTTILNPEAVIFANPIAQGVCAADAIASGFHLPLDVLFWCAGSQGSMYPFNGWVSKEISPLQSSVLVTARMAFKLHRQGQIWETIGKDREVCYKFPSPIMPKARWRYQMVCTPTAPVAIRWGAA
ncbi:TraU protein (plasmid) [Sodalis glossinidius str. 'morsitans']|uniref:TraU protein n=1 Tax=Sodalis glossinidius (strain morsitans) TaxID=343509 RepID=A0A193QPF4_SODGM|nr:TraU protein [Sodalis glossinidius]CAI59450.1 TraU protein [Sodalis glossinidius]CRL46830.1 TraU protein [Sodalis glossinidius str. 'morsitans']